MSHCSSPSLNGSRFDVHLLELNAEPAIELTGERLTWILEDLFKAIALVCVEPFFNTEKNTIKDDWKIGQVRQGLKKCLEVPMRID